MRGKELALLVVVIACILFVPVIILYNCNYNNNSDNNKSNNNHDSVIYEAIQENYQPTQPGTFFDENNPRFVLVDRGVDFDNRPCVVYADTVSGAMFLVVKINGNYVGFTLPSEAFQYDPLA